MNLRLIGYGVIKGKKLYAFEEGEIPPWWHITKEDPLLVLASTRFKRIRQVVYLGLGILLLSGYDPFAYLLIKWWNDGVIEIAKNGVPSEYVLGAGWASNILLLILLIPPIVGLIFVFKSIKMALTKPRIYWFSKNGVHIYELNKKIFHDWSEFDANSIEISSFETIELQFIDSIEKLVIGKIATAMHSVSQVVELKITGNTKLLNHDKLINKKKSKRSVNKYILYFLNTLLRLLEGTRLMLFALLFVPVPFVLFTAVYTVIPERLPRYSMILFIMIVSLGFTYQFYSYLKKIISLNNKAEYKTKLSELFWFKSYLFFLMLGLIFLAYSIVFPFLGVDFSPYFNRLIVLFLIIPVIIVNGIISYYLSEYLKDFIHPILLLRPFGIGSMRGEWSNRLEANDNVNDSSDQFLTSVGNVFKVKKTYTYHDRRVDSSGLRDESFGYLPEYGEWFEHVKKCAQLSHAIIIVPFNSGSVLKEMKMLVKEGLLHKTFVLMPPDLEGDKIIEPQWNNIKMGLEPLGYLLPRYQEGGMVYYPNEDFSVKKAWNLQYKMDYLIYLKPLRNWVLSEKSITEKLF